MTVLLACLVIAGGAGTYYLRSRANTRLTGWVIAWLSVDTLEPYSATELACALTAAGLPVSIERVQRRLNRLPIDLRRYYIEYNDDVTETAKPTRPEVRTIQYFCPNWTAVLNLVDWLDQNPNVHVSMAFVNEAFCRKSLTDEGLHTLLRKLPAPHRGRITDLDDLVLR